MGASMARLPRYALPGQPQHIIQRGNNRSAMFATDADYRRFREYLRIASKRHGCTIHSYVFMTNHVHLLATPARAGAIGRVMQSVGRRYVQHFNRAYGRTGTLWEGRYRAAVIDSERYLLTCYRYIERNPVRAGMVADPANYPWSSYRANAHGEPDPLVTPHELYARLAEDDANRRAAYRELCRSDVDASTLRALRVATRTGWALGGSRFCRKIERLTGRRASPQPKGRRAAIS